MHVYNIYSYLRVYIEGSKWTSFDEKNIPLLMHFVTFFAQFAIIQNVPFYDLQFFSINLPYFIT